MIVKKSNMCKIQLAIANNFFSSIYNDEELVMHSKRVPIVKDYV